MAEASKKEHLDTIKKASSVISESSRRMYDFKKKSPVYSTEEAEAELKKAADGTPESMDRIVNSALVRGVDELDILDSIHKGAVDGEVRAKRPQFLNLINGLKSIIKDKFHLK